MARRKVVPTDASLLNRAQTARVLGCSEWQLRQMQSSGTLSSVQIEGAYFFRIEHVQGLAKRHNEHSRSAQCFELFERGVPPERVVIELQMHHAEVQEAHTAWLRMVDGVSYRPEANMTRKRWEQAYGVKMHPQNLLRALSIVATHADLRGQLELVDEGHGGHGDRGHTDPIVMVDDRVEAAE